MKEEPQTIISGADDVEKFDFPETREEFKFYTESQIREEFEMEDSRVAAEVTRLVCLCTLRIKAYMEKYGYVPPHILHIRIRWPIEKVAMQLVAEYVNKTTLH